MARRYRWKRKTYTPRELEKAMGCTCKAYTRRAMRGLHSMRCGAVRAGHARDDAVLALDKKRR